MKQFLFTSLLLLFVIFQVNGQAETAQHSDKLAVSLANIEFNLVSKPSTSTFQVQFLMPRAQEMEIYLVDLNGDKVTNYLEKQIINAGVRTYNFSFPDNTTLGVYMLVIKSGEKSVIKRIEHKPKV